MTSLPLTLIETAFGLVLLGACGLVGANAPALESTAGSPPSMPAVLDVRPPKDTLFGTLLIELLVAGTPQQSAAIRVEYDLLGDEPDQGWRLARAVEDERTEDYVIRDVHLESDGTPLAFFWDTDTDLPGREAYARLRVTVVDGRTSAPFESAPFRVNNH